MDEQANASESSSFVVAAIDFGTTFSGFAFSFRSDFTNDPLKVHLKEWPGTNFVSQKCPTSVLLEEKDGKIELVSFGYDAESQYSLFAMEGNTDCLYFFRRFKMMLFEAKEIKRDMLLNDAVGKKLPALQVFGLSIKFMKDELMAMIENRIKGLVKEDEVHWVITVPAIWNNMAKEFMREAASQAGIPDRKLSIALEPEAGSLCSRHLSLQKTKGASGSELQNLAPGTKYVLLDAGGGTVDIAVHEVLPDGDLRELFRASGGDWGGTKVDEAFEQFLIRFVGQEVWEKFLVENMEDYVDLFGHFEIKKRTIAPTTTRKVDIQIPAVLNELLVAATGNNLNDVIQMTEFANRITIKRDRMLLDSEILKDCFKASLSSIVSHLKTVLEEPAVQDCSSVLMVGGFSESTMLVNAVRKAFPHYSTNVPVNAGLAVLKGAVIFGHNPKAITERVCRFSYGVGVMRSFVEGEHPVEKKRILQGDAICVDIFGKHVTVGDVVKLDEVQHERNYKTICSSGRKIVIGLFASPQTDPKYITDPGCFAVGTFEAHKITDTNRSMKLGLMFGGTEIRIKVTEDVTGDSHCYTLSLPH